MQAPGCPVTGGVLIGVLGGTLLGVLTGVLGGALDGVLTAACSAAVLVGVVPGTMVEAALRALRTEVYAALGLLLRSNSSGFSLPRQESLSRMPHVVMPTQRGTLTHAWVRPWYWLAEALVTSASVNATSTPRAAKLDRVVWKLLGKRAAAGEVGLQADAVDRDATGLEVLDHVVDALRLGVRPVLDVVVVVAQLHARVGGPRGPERHLDPVVTGGLQVRRPTAAVLGEGLVDHVPVGEFALVVGHDAVDVLDHRGAQAAAAEAPPEPRLLGVPGQGVATDPHAVLDGPVVDRVAGAEGELRRCWARSRRASSR